jgi:hypothetical protein
LRRSRLLIGWLAATPLVLALLVGLLGPLGTNAALVGPAALLGLVSPVIGYRLYLLLRDRIPSEADVEARCRSFVSAGLVALAVTDGIALLGLVAYFVSGQPYSLVGVATHVLLAGAIWPSPERLQAFVEGPER